MHRKGDPVPWRHTRHACTIRCDSELLKDHCHRKSPLLVENVRVALVLSSPTKVAVHTCPSVYSSPDGGKWHSEPNLLFLLRLFRLHTDASHDSSWSFCLISGIIHRLCPRVKKKLNQKQVWHYLHLLCRDLLQLGSWSQNLQDRLFYDFFPFFPSGLQHSDLVSVLTTHSHKIFLSDIKPLSLVRGTITWKDTTRMTLLLHSWRHQCLLILSGFSSGTVTNTGSSYSNIINDFLPIIFRWSKDCKDPLQLHITLP